MRRPLFKQLLATAVILTAVLFVGHYTAAQVPAKLTAAQWQADIRFLGDELPKRHKNAFYRLKREDFEAAVNTLYAAVPKMSDDEIVVGLMKLVAMVHDGHTNLLPWPFLRTGVFPLRFYKFSDGVYIQKASPKYAELVGARVLRIGNSTIDDAMKAVGAVVPADNEMGVLGLGPTFLSAPEILAGLKIISDKQALDLVISKDGRERMVSLRPEAIDPNVLSPHAAPPADWADAANTQNVPPYLTHRGEPFWFEYLKDKQIVYVKQDAVQNTDKESLADFYNRVFDFVDANPVDKLVIDLRNNGGGNNSLNSPIIIDMIRSKVDKRGHLFVITGRQTFSAAQNFTNQIEKWTEAIFVGEPTADHVNMYGDPRPFILPNSGLTVFASTLWWQDLDPRDERRWKAPDIAADVSFDDYRTGRDPALQAVLDYKSGSTMGEIIRSAASGDSLADFVERYRAERLDPKNKYVNAETTINQLGYTLLAKKRPSDAIEVLKLNTEFYPASANAFDSLGEAFAAAGRTDDAVRSYEKAISIDPKLQSSLDALKRLRKN